MKSNEITDLVLVGTFSSGMATAVGCDWISSMQCSLSRSHRSASKLKVGVRVDPAAGGGTTPAASDRSPTAAQLSSNATARSDEYCASRKELDISTECRWRTFSSRDFPFLQSKNKRKKNQ